MVAFPCRLNMNHPPTALVGSHTVSALVGFPRPMRLITNTLTEYLEQARL